MLALTLFLDSREGGPEIDKPLGVFENEQLANEAKDEAIQYYLEEYDIKLKDEDFGLQTVNGLICVQFSWDFHGENQNDVIGYARDEVEAKQMMEDFERNRKLEQEDEDEDEKDKQEDQYEIGYTKMELNHLDLDGDLIEIPV